MKQIILLILLGSIVSCSFGQFYLQPSIGYTFSSHPIENQTTLIVDNLKTVNKTKLKHGDGMHLGLNIGYNLMNNFFVEVNTKQTIYSSYKESTEQPDLQSLNNYSISGYFGEINYENSIFQVTPQIGYQIQKNKFSTYFKIGPNFMKSTINQTQKYIEWRLGENAKFYPLNTIEKIKYGGKFHLGLQANLGLSYSIKSNILLVLDFVTVYNNYKITNAEIKKYEIDGVNHLDDLDDTNIEIDEEENKLNLSHYGINIGIKYIFNKNK